MNRNLVNHLHVAGGAIQNPLPGYTTLFLAKVSLGASLGFCAVFGPTATCLPEKVHDTCELFDAVFSLFDTSGILISMDKVHHGHKYGHGGGWVEIDKHNSAKGVAWLKSGMSEPGKRSHFMGDTIRPEDVLVAL